MREVESRHAFVRRVVDDRTCPLFRNVDGARDAWDWYRANAASRQFADHVAIRYFRTSEHQAEHDRAVAARAAERARRKDLARQRLAGSGKVLVKNWGKMWAWLKTYSNVPAYRSMRPEDL